MSTLIAVCRGETSRFTQFDSYLHSLARPDGSQVQMFIDRSIARGRNAACEALLGSSHSHMFFLDDDHAFAPIILEQLLARDLDIVSGTYLLRKWPFHVCAFRSWVNETREFGRPLALAPGLRGLQKVKVIGCGALLIKRSVIETIPSPWFTLGHHDTDHIAEDFTFFRRVEDHQLDAWLDLDVILGHCTTIPIWPYREGQEWLTLLTSGEEKVPIPTAIELLIMKRAEMKRDEKAQRAQDTGLVGPDGHPIASEERLI